MGLRADLDRYGKSRSHRDLIPPTVQLVGIRYTIDLLPIRIYVRRIYLRKAHIY